MQELWDWAVWLFAWALLINVVLGFFWALWYSFRIVRALPMGFRVWAMGLTRWEQQDIIRKYGGT